MFWHDSLPPGERAGFVPTNTVKKTEQMFVKDVDKLRCVEKFTNASAAPVRLVEFKCPISPHLAPHMGIYSPLISAQMRRKSMFYSLASGLHKRDAKGASLTGAKKNTQKERTMEAKKQAIETCTEEPRILEEIHVEELAIDGICGVY